jgi:hypothetical protein
VLPFGACIYILSYLYIHVCYATFVLVSIARKLDRWVAEENVRRRADGGPSLKRCEIKVFGQAALLELQVPLTLAATSDVDVRATYEHPIEVRFRELLAAQGRHLDPVAHEAWMPRETRYEKLFDGALVALLVAEPEAILVSKALKAPLKNRALLTEYLAMGASERFLSLARKYGVSLEQFL